MKKYVLSALILLLCLSLFACAKRIAEVELKGDMRPKGVLIAAENSGFKGDIISLIMKDLESKSCPTKLIDVKKLKKVDSEKFQAIVIVNTCWAWQLDRNVKKFLKRVNSGEQGKIILLTTSGSGEWEPKGVKVDAISSASNVDKADVVAQTIIAKLDVLIQK